MAQYKTGTVTIDGSPTPTNIVTGSGTLWSANVSVGDIFTVVGDNAWYEIASVDSDTQITLSANYSSDVTAVSYTITRDFTTRLGLPYPQNKDIETASLIKRAFSEIDSNLNVNKNNFTATTDPAINDDSGDGYVVGSLWVNTSTDEAYMCMDSSVGAAVWVRISADTMTEISGTIDGGSF